MVMKDEQGRTLNKDGSLRKPRTPKAAGEKQFFLVIPWRKNEYSDSGKKYPTNLQKLFENDYEWDYLVEATSHEDALVVASKDSDYPEVWNDADIITVVPVDTKGLKKFKPLDITVKFLPI